MYILIRYLILHFEFGYLRFWRAFRWGDSSNGLVLIIFIIGNIFFKSGLYATLWIYLFSILPVSMQMLMPLLIGSHIISHYFSRILFGNMIFYASIMIFTSIIWLNVQDEHAILFQVLIFSDYFDLKFVIYLPIIFNICFFNLLTLLTMSLFSQLAAKAF